jgi:hypothetical protein
MSDQITLVLLIAMVAVPLFGIAGYFGYQSWLKTVAVKCVFMTGDRKIIARKLKVNDGTVTLKDKTYLLNKDLFMIGKGNWPTYYFKMEDAKPLNMLDFKTSGLGSSELNAQINGRLMKDLLGSFEKKMDAGTLTMLFGIITLAGLGGLIYIVTERFDQIMALLTELRDVLRLVGGV